MGVGGLDAFGALVGVGAFVFSSLGGLVGVGGLEAFGAFVGESTWAGEGGVENVGAGVFRPIMPIRLAGSMASLSSVALAFRMRNGLLNSIWSSASMGEVNVLNRGRRTPPRVRAVVPAKSASNINKLWVTLMIFLLLR